MEEEEEEEERPQTRRNYDKKQITAGTGGSHLVRFFWV